MQWRKLEARIARLEALFARVQEKEIIVGSFSLYGFRLPEGTAVPEGGRVVEDYFSTWDSAPDEHGVVRSFGYWRERITFDPEDQGRSLPASEDELNRADQD